MLETCRGMKQTYCKTKFCASSWLITKIHILRCTVSKTSKNSVHTLVQILNFFIQRILFLALVIAKKSGFFIFLLYMLLLTLLPHCDDDYNNNNNNTLLQLLQQLLLLLLFVNAGTYAHKEQ